jgi:hypothetical protein
MKPEKKHGLSSLITVHWPGHLLASAYEPVPASAPSPTADTVVATAKLAKASTDADRAEELRVLAELNVQLAPLGWPALGADAKRDSSAIRYGIAAQFSYERYLALKRAKVIKD